MAEVFAERDLRAMVVRGADGMDEVTIAGPTDVWDVTDEGVGITQVDPLGAGVAEHDAALLTGGDAATNARLTRAVLAGETDGPLAAIRDAVILNSGLALVVWDAALGEGRYGPVTDTAAQRLARAVPDAAESIATGRAAAVLDRWIEVSAAHSG
jgi:anthranilate phosphoribosyltransferase